MHMISEIKNSITFLCCFELSLVTMKCTVSRQGIAKISKSMLYCPVSNEIRPPEQYSIMALFCTQFGHY